ncbi:MAG: hypothetical protein LBH04_11080 [Tannerellaceae bacterium]|jgi:hypothetical protein|nr:hypothetical protein [Tannerellaceae bacterium]
MIITKHPLFFVDVPADDKEVLRLCAEYIMEINETKNAPYPVHPIFQDSDSEDEGQSHERAGLYSLAVGASSLIVEFSTLDLDVSRQVTGNPPQVMEHAPQTLVCDSSISWVMKMSIVLKPFIYIN